MDLLTAWPEDNATRHFNVPTCEVPERISGRKSHEEKGLAAFDSLNGDALNGKTTAETFSLREWIARTFCLVSLGP